MTGYIERHVDEYDLCQRIKNGTEAPAENLIANEVCYKLHLACISITSRLIFTK